MSEDGEGKGRHSARRAILSVEADRVARDKRERQKLRIARFLRDVKNPELAHAPSRIQ